MIMSWIFTIAITFLLVLSITLLAYAPDFFRWYRARRSLRLAEARLKLTETATEVQQYMCDSTLIHGGAIHDVFYHMINNAQYMDNYIAFWPVVIPGSRTEVYSLVQQIRGELKELPKEIDDLIDCHIDAFLEAAAIRNPVSYRLLFTLFIVRFIQRIALSRANRLVAELKKFFSPSDVWHDRPILSLVGVWAIAISLFLINNPGLSAKHIVMQSSRTRHSTNL